MFPQFTNTAASLTRATALIHRVGTDAYLYDDPEDANIASLLDSKFEAEKVQGLKRLIALLSQGVDVSNFFPQVVKNVASTSLEIKKLVYIYLVHYAERRPDEALLSINSFQKDLSDLNPLVRGWSLRAMSGIRVRVVVPLVVMAVHKCSRDPSPYVRQCAAHAIPKIFALDREAHAEALEELVCLFLNDSSAGVVGAAAAAFIVVCPDHLSLLGPMFRKLCEMLLDVEEWGQVVLMDILMRYAVARYGAPRDSVFLSSSSHTQIQERPELLPEDASEKVDLSADVRGLLHCTAPLLWSQNSAVVMATAAVHWVFASKTDLKKIVKPLLFLLRSSYDSQYVVLANIATFASTASSLFEPYYEEFFIRSSDTEPLRALKLDILTAIATESSIHPILREFQAYLRNPDRQFAADTVNAIGRCAVRLPAVASSCVEGLLMLAKGGIINSDRIEEAANGEDNSNLSAHGDLKNSVSEKYSREAAVVAQAVLALRTIVQQHPAEQEEVFARLVRTLDHVKVPKARAVVIWMVGEYGVSSGRVSQMLPVLLRYLAGSFIKEANESKLQILNCAAKVVLQLEGAPDSPLVRTATLVLQHVINLGSQDLNNDIRDRARLLCHLLTSQSRPRLQNVQNEHHPDSAEQLLALESSTEPVQQEKLKKPVDGNGNTVLALSEDKAAKVLAKLAHQILLVPKSPPVLPALAPDRSAFLPGSMSHIVHHKAPGYAELPDPCSIRAPDLHSQENLGETAKDLRLSRGRAHRDRLASEYSDSASDEGQSDVSSTGSRNWSSDGYSDQEGGAAHESGVENRNMNDQHQGRRRLAQTEENLAPLISIDDEAPDGQENTSLGEINRGLEGLQLNAAANLESWLGAPDTEVADTSTMKVAEGSSYLTLSLKPIHPVFKRQTLLDFTNGEGLDVRYSFTQMPSVSSQGMVCVRLYLQNRSAEPMLGITVRALEVVAASVAPEADDQVQAGTTEESKTVLPLEEISNLNPGDTKEGDVHIDFKHQLTPAKLEIVCDGKVYPVKLSPEVGALVRPLPLSMDAFTSAELSISGMHESSRRCYLRNILSEPLQSSNTAGQTGEDKAFVVSRKIAAQVLSIAHVDIVSVTLPIASSSVVQFGGQTDLTGLKLRFCGETLTGSVTCLISVTVMAKTENDSDTNDLPVLIKVNCEDTIFGLNLLRKLHQDLSS